MRTFSIRSLMAVVVVAAIGMAAFVVGSPPWAGAMLSLSFFALTCALLGVAFGRNERRIYWIGFASLGWAYMALIYAPVIDVKVSRYLFGSRLSQAIYDAIHAEAPAPGGGGFQSVPIGPLAAGAAAGGGGGGGGRAMGGAAAPNPADLDRVAIAIEALLWAFLGGWAALYFASGEDGCLGEKRSAEITRPTPANPTA
ncbi:hypothetical protein [Paludisphaera rhizosphaerae]|uniref:hypothetical protein n=1 Tax=Paludisphaera rhizosphaerae TaxID=2711216 RepID=UPI0013ED06F5|nr:hypothetical protein [Paludisphaera rhizosphaerae]